LAHPLGEILKCGKELKIFAACRVRITKKRQDLGLALKPRFRCGEKCRVSNWHVAHAPGDEGDVSDARSGGRVRARRRAIMRIQDRGRLFEWMWRAIRTCDPRTQLGTGDSTKRQFVGTLSRSPVTSLRDHLCRLANDPGFRKAEPWPPGRSLYNRGMSDEPPRRLPCHQAVGHTGDRRQKSPVHGGQSVVFNWRQLRCLESCRPRRRSGSRTPLRPSDTCKCRSLFRRA
jgi:hypothetical protein